ncbi:ATP-binding protein [Tepidibacillus fermentans]|uniref:histidine kinase n=1 Tax=Tepidibacillus fermentans TaxID=1281767 RepID=A0A4R3KGB1_9BACI|nr:ATP-binding protein [Tepidibacillus fermentans]TCS82446.1 Cache sensor signal transduction histidine kinase [Tepidibacillus fermentans]
MNRHLGKNKRYSLSFWNRIKFKLLFFGITMSILPIAIVGGYNIQTSKNTLEEGVKEKQLYIVQRAATEVDHLLSTIDSKMQLTIDANDVITNNSQAKQRWEQSLYGFLKQDPEIENAFLLDQQGQVITGVSRWMSKDKLQQMANSLHELVLQNTTNKQDWMSSVQFKADGTPSIRMVRTVYSPEDHSYQGHFVVDVNLKGTFQNISAIHSGKNGYIYLIDDKSRLIAHTDFGQVILGKNVIQAPELQKMIDHKGRMSEPTQYRSYTGEKVIGAYAPIASANWGVIIEQPIAQAFASIQFLIQRLLIMMGLVSGIVVLLSVVFGIWFTKPIELMEKAVQKVTKGKLDAKINYQSKDEFGQLAAAFNHMTDELQLKTDHLAREKEHLDTIVNGSGSGFALIHDDYSVEWMNDRLRQWLADDRQQFSCYSLLGRLSEPCQNCPITLKDPMQCQNEIVTTVQNNGQKKMYSHRMYPLEKVREGDPKYLVVVEDVTEQRQLEEMVIQADKLSALGILASGFAHEVNNPLASISAYAEDLKERIKEEPIEELVQAGEIDRYLDIIRNNVDRCKGITGSLLNFTRKTSFVTQDIDLSKLIEDSLILMQHVLKKKQIQIDKLFQTDLPLVHGDSLQIQQVLINIIQNAIDAMDEGGQLTLSTHKSLNQVEIQIQDNGQGMTSDQLQKVFDPFYTTKPVGKGTGLGLYISYQIMKKMNGDIQIESQQGKGTVVRIIFPTA